MRFSGQFCAVCSRVIEDDMALYEPECLAPVFAARTGLACYVTVFFHLILAIFLIVTLWHPAGLCAWKRLLHRIQYCTVGNNDDCLEI